MHLEVEMGRRKREHRRRYMHNTIWKMEAATGVHSPVDISSAERDSGRREKITVTDTAGWSQG